MHHPIHSQTRRARFLAFGRRGTDERLREQLEPLFIEHDVDIVFQGHQHLYARLRPQRGVRYIVTGGGSRKPTPSSPMTRPIRAATVAGSTISSPCVHR